MTLGITLSGAFSLMLVLRPPLQRRIVLAAPLEERPKRQFHLDLMLCLAAGSLVAIFNRYAHNFYLISGLSLLSGCFVVGFFQGLDMALVRERDGIREALTHGRNTRPPKRYYPMTRRFSVVAFCLILFICIILALVISRDFAWLAQAKGSAASLKEAERIVMVEVAFIMTVLLGMVVNLIISYSHNLKLLFDNETQILENVSRGDLSQMVPVATRDEFGVIAGHTNSMIEGLRHRTELIQALKLADEVQKNLLPRQVEKLKGADIAGASLYCTETGGDYYDYFQLAQNRLGIVVADVSGHGISSALHMTTARAHLISGVKSYSSGTALIEEVNQYLSHDIRESGWFITLFWLEIDMGQRRMAWIRAGHDPALFYDPQQDRFHRLDGVGLALGIDATVRFKEYEKRNWSPGSIIVMGTDGLHETRDSKGRMYGQNRLRQIVRRHRERSAAHIKDVILDAVETHRGDQPREDDTTLVVVKLA